MCIEVKPGKEFAWIRDPTRQCFGIEARTSGDACANRLHQVEKFPGSRSLQLRLSRSSSFQCSLQRSFEKMVRVCERNSASVAFSGRTWIFSSSRAAALPCRKSEPFAQ